MGTSIVIYLQRPVYLVTHKKQPRLKCVVASMGSNHQVEEDITNTLEQHPNWKSAGVGGHDWIPLLWNNIIGSE
ncbi:hypothetical protein SO802_005375 [Lithocarpus litseifolius]|uniref:Uncharacterized protein n=1 Tax=Lithocarpus litseifolius TaxID=425828 RepID=A0AAW2DI00_9ROSI